MLKNIFIDNIATLVKLITVCFDKKSASVGIIGSADGPTAIFISPKSSWWYVPGIIILAFIIILLLTLLLKKKK